MLEERYKISKKLHAAEGELAYLLDVFGDTIAKREGYKTLHGLEAVHFYLIHKFGWIPSQVKSMSSEDLRFVLSEEMSNWIAPKAAL